ncbi:MAG: bacillithiol biosynthesis cysteine-adding enzyme BshC [Gemmatimonadetes bacterium]|nr:bacillithiol biosynthesis cysteine-adding enzyme BshC [Gemmatimonadota bacterium]
MAEPLNLEINVAWPSGGPLAMDYLAGAPKALSFYASHFADPDAYHAKAVEVDSRFDRDARRRAAEAIRIPADVGGSRLDRFVDEGGYMVTTGQQPGLFSGPLYSVYKAVTALRLANHLEERLGKPVLPVFWVGSEDHDWQEVNHAYVVGTDNDLLLSSLGDRPGDVHPSVSRIPLGESVADVRDTFVAALPRTDFSEPYAALLEEAVTPGVTLPESFHRILEELLGPAGLCFTDAADPVLKSASAGILDQELTRSSETESILAATAHRLEAAGYGLQVALMEGGVNLFLEGAAGRERLYRDSGGFRLHASGEVLDLDGIRARVTEDPGSLSPNVLLRPVVESAVFPTLSYVAGPGEIAYFAQIREFFEAFSIRMPVVHPRHGATVVESKVRKVLDKFGLQPDALARPFHEVAGEIAREEIPEDVRRALGALRGAVGKGVGDLQSAVKALDPTLKGPVQHVRAQAFAALDELERKVVQAVKRESEIALAQLEKAQLHLYPGGKPQERVLNVFYYLFRYGGAFLDALHDRFALNLDRLPDV